MLAPLRALAPLAALLLLGCFSDVETPFPAGLEPLEEENLAAFPEGTDEQPFPEQMRSVRDFASDTTSRTHSVHARGYVRAPLVDVWAALRDPDVGADRRTFSEWSTTQDVEPEYDYSYVIHSVIENVITVEYDVTWRHGVVVGTVEAPTIAAARYQKTSGSTAISDLRGSVVLRALSPSVTAVEIIEFLAAVASNHRNIEEFLRDMFAELVIRAHGGELPPIDEL